MKIIKFPLKLCIRSEESSLRDVGTSMLLVKIRSIYRIDVDEYSASQWSTSRYIGYMQVSIQHLIGAHKEHTSDRCRWVFSISLEHKQIHRIHAGEYSAPNWSTSRYIGYMQVRIQHLIGAQADTSDTCRWVFSTSLEHRQIHRIHEDEYSAPHWSTSRYIGYM
jgi:outer membrane phospholipase A